MAQRGRPRHPDILTPREWEVLSLVREGLSNPQIGERLGITSDAAKYHVSEILSKLGVSTREEAAAWRPEPATSPVMRPLWARTLALAGALLRRLSWPVAARTGALLVALTAVAGLAVLLWGVLRTEGDDEGGSVEGTATPGLSGSAAPTETVAPGPNPLILGDPLSFPASLAVIVETGCTSCDGGASGLARVTRSASGEIRWETLFSAGVHFYLGENDQVETREEYLAGGVNLPRTRLVQSAKGIEEEATYITGYGISGDISTIVVGLCVRGFCNNATGVSSESEDAQTVLYRSANGGVTWEEVAVLDYGAAIRGVTPDGRALAIQFDSVASQFAGVFLEPGHDEVVRPDLASGVFEYPLVLGDGRIAWPSRGAWYAEDGAILAAPPISSGPNRSQFLVAGPEGQLAQLWNPGNVDLPTQLSFSDGGGTGESYSAGSVFRIGAWPSVEWLLGNISTGSLRLEAPSGLLTMPAVINPRTGEVNPLIDAFGDPEVELGRNSVMAAATGSFVRVTGTGSCLNIRDEPSEEGRAITCAADGVLLHVLEPNQQLPWVHVSTPDGIDGYANSGYLEFLLGGQ